MCDSILKPVCVLAVNIRRCLLVVSLVSVTGRSLYRNAWVFMTGSCSTGGAPAALVTTFSCFAPFVCADAVAAAANAGSKRPRSLREYFMVCSLLFECEPVYTDGLTVASALSGGLCFPDRDRSMAGAVLRAPLGRCR